MQFQITEIGNDGQVQQQNSSQAQDNTTQVKDSLVLQQKATVTQSQSTKLDEVIQIKQQSNEQDRNNQIFVNKIEKEINCTLNDVTENERIKIEDIETNPSFLKKLTNHESDIELEKKKFIILILHQMFKENTNIRFVITNDTSKSSSLSYLPLISYLSDSENFQFKIPDSDYKDFTFDGISKDETTMNNFKMDIRENIAKAYNIPIHDVIITNICKGSINIDFVIQGFSALTEKNHKDKIDIARKSLKDNMKLKDVDFTMQQKTYILNIRDFDSRGNFTFSKGDETQKRGGQPYYQPSGPWQRVGLRVRDRDGYPNDGWIEMDGNPNEWAVAFHGVREGTGYAFPKISQEGLKEGRGQGYKNHKCLRTGQIIGTGIYCTPKIDIAAGYFEATSLNGQNYKYVFQCRVKPSAILDAGGDIWIIKNKEDIRPYGVLFRTC